jgi:hypothetical protein
MRLVSASAALGSANAGAIMARFGTKPSASVNFPA